MHNIYKYILEEGRSNLYRLKGTAFDDLTLARPNTPEKALYLPYVISKLSALMGNLIEFDVCNFLNDISSYKTVGHWIRQDPGFPDTVFQSNLIGPQPGFEIKAWLPLSTEITARFKDSQKFFNYDQTEVILLAWLPEFVIYGKPKIIDVCCIKASSIASYRDNHYNNIPDYIVLEPENTSHRTRNLQQTNVNGYKFQGSTSEYLDACNLVASWGPLEKYSSSHEYQKLLRILLANYPYRLDTNFAKMDRISHPEIEAFKTKVLSSDFYGKSILEWQKILSHKDSIFILGELENSLNLKF